MTIESYIKNIGGSTVLIAKVKEIKKLADQICPEKIVAFHLSEFKKTNGERKFESVFFFSEKFILESHNILTDELNIDIALIKGYIDFYKIELKDYNYVKAVEASKMQIMGQLGNAIILMKATGNNCDNLWKIIHEFIKPNIYSELEFEKE